MIIKEFTTGEIIRVSFDQSSRYLEIVWRNKSVVAHKPVPEEVFRRLYNAPNRAVYYEDRVAEEYPKVQVKRSSSVDARSKPDDLFR
jgi:hypothetical protein